MNALFAIPALILVGLSVKYIRRNLKDLRTKKLQQCLEEHHVLGRKIFHCWDASLMEQYVAEIKEWEQTYSGRVERGMLNRLHDDLQKEWHTRYYLVKPNQKSA